MMDQSSGEKKNNERCHFYHLDKHTHTEKRKEIGVEKMMRNTCIYTQTKPYNIYCGFNEMQVAASCF